MINLLPPDIKNGYRYAHSNVSLRRWVIMCVIALVGLGGLATYGLFTLHQSTNHYTNQIAMTEATLQKEKFGDVQKQVKDISNSFKLVVQVLSQEVLFSQLIKHIAVTLPTNANLTALNIAQVKGGIDIVAIAPNYTTASQVQVNLADPTNKIFSKADIVSIICSVKGAINPNLPCTVTVRALFANNNPFLFINSKVKAP